MHARGDVELKLNGEKFTLRGTFQAVADYQAALGVDGLVPIIEMLGAFHAEALVQGVRCLGSKKAHKKLLSLNYGEHHIDVQEAILQALTASMPEPDQDGEDEPEKPVSEEKT